MSSISLVNNNIHFLKIVLCLGFLSLHGINVHGQLSNDAYLKEISIIADDRDYAQKIQEVFTEPFQLEDVTFETDVYMQPNEFWYLVDLRPGATVCAVDLIRAVGYLKKKNKFEIIMLQLSQAGQSKKIHFKLSGFWTFARLKLHGILLGKDRFRQYYLLEPGEPFDEQKHKQSIERIKEVFTEEGYCAPDIQSRLEYNNTTKSVTAHLTLVAGRRFTIDSLDIVIRNRPLNDEMNYEALERSLFKEFGQRIQGSYFSKKVLNVETLALKRYLAKRGFVHVDIELQEHRSVEDTSVGLTFYLDLYQKKEFIFVGNRFFSEDELLDAILLFGRSAWMLPPTILQQEIEQLYRKKGFWNCVVESREENNAYFFIINEGQRASVKKITFKKIVFGNQASLVKDHYTEFLALKNYEEEPLFKAEESMIAWYISQGFLDAKVVKKDFVPTPTKKNKNLYELVIILDEGQRVSVDSIKIDAFRELEDEGPFLAFRQATQLVPFVMQDIQDQRKWLATYFQKKGYVGVKIDPEFKRTGSTISLVWHIKTGESQSRFGKTVLLGSSTFPFEYLLREMRYKEGDTWDQTKLKDSLLKLKGLGIFETVHLYPHDVSRQEIEQPVIVKVQQEERFELRTRAGFAVQQVNKFLDTAGLTYRIGGAFFIKNPFNRGDLINIDADVDRSQRVFSVEYVTPWIFNMPIRTVVEGYDNKYQQPGLVGYKKNLYEIYQQGFVLGLLGQYSYFDIGLNVGIELMKTTMCEEDKCIAKLLADRLARAINFAPQLLDKKIPYFQFEPTLLIDRLDYKLQPTKGTFTLISLKGMLPLNRIGFNSYFVRFMAEHSFFVPCQPVIFGLRVRFGHIFHRLLSNIMPTERFYLGGANSVRSYETDRCPPLGIFYDDNECPQYVPQGGKSMANLNAEIRFPIINHLGGVVFQDWGALSGDKIRDFLERPILAATGCGLRYATPIGPLRFDIAWKWHRDNPTELPIAWFLSISQAF